MRESPYYSVRVGKRSARINFNELKGLFLAAFSDLEADGYFQEVLRTKCVDGDGTGTAGSDVEVFFFRKLKKRDLWPFEDFSEHWSEEDLFDIIELLHDCASKGVDGTFHSYLQCGMHYQTFDQAAGRRAFRAAMNELLREYEHGYTITSRGEIVALGPNGLRHLERAPRPPGDPVNVQQRVEDAVDKFRRRHSTTSDRRDAVRDLADVLEFLRPQVKTILSSQDESDLFNLANNFGIRHHNQRQKTQYDEPIWQSWLFYYFLATIHATTRLIEKVKKQ